MRAAFDLLYDVLCIGEHVVGQLVAFNPALPEKGGRSPMVCHYPASVSVVTVSGMRTLFWFVIGSSLRAG
jgi:hypothetical protein